MFLSINNLMSSPLWSLSLLTNLLLLLLLSTAAQSDRVKNKIYSYLDSSNFCFRRLNGTNQIGCSSSEGGNYGIAKLVRDGFFQDDLEFITTHGSEAPYVAILSSHHFDLSTLLLLKKASNRVSGVVVVDSEKPSAFTSDRSCPNEYFSLYVNDSKHSHCQSQQWNLPATNHRREYQEGILFYDWPFPIFLLRNKTEIEFFLNKTKEFKYDQWPKLAIELVSPMSGAKDSVTCMRRSLPNSWFSLDPEQYCDPLGGINMYHHTINLTSTKQIANNSVVMLASRLDSFSMFDNLSPGADSAMSSLIAILSVAEMFNRDEIKQSLKENDAGKNLIISLFDGEAFDYIGSSFAVDQLSRNVFSLLKHRSSDNSLDASSTLDLGHLSHFIEFNQLANYNNTAVAQKIYLHKHLTSSDQLNILIKTFTEEASDMKNLLVNPIPDGNPLPPSSAQSFLKKRNDANFSALVVTNHEKEYINQYYNSFYDDGTGMSIDLTKYLVSLSTLFTRVTYKLLTGKRLNSLVKANEDLVEGLVKCFIKTSSCEYFHYVQDENVPNRSDYEPPFPSYVSVYGADDSKVLRLYTLSLFHYLTGERMTDINSSNDCRQLSDQDKDSQYNYLWQNGKSMKGECVRSVVYSVNSISPAFNPSTYEVIFDNVDQYSIWTESKWKINSLRMFVVSSRTQQILTLILGLVIFIFSFIVVFYFSRNSEIFFGFDETNNGDVLVDDSLNTTATLVNNRTNSGDYSNWIRSPNGIEYAAINPVDRSNTNQVFT